MQRAIELGGAVDTPAIISAKCIRCCERLSCFDDDDGKRVRRDLTRFGRGLIVLLHSDALALFPVRIACPTAVTALPQRCYHIAALYNHYVRILACSYLLRR